VGKSLELFVLIDEWLDDFPAHRASSLCSKPLVRTPFAEPVSTFESFTTLGFVADWALLFGNMHPAKIPILLGVGAAITTLFDSLADGVNCGAVGTRKPKACLELGASHLGPSAKHLSLETLSDRIFVYKNF
jgi:hypothetical protein